MSPSFPRVLSSIQPLYEYENGFNLVPQDKSVLSAVCLEVPDFLSGVDTDSVLGERTVECRSPWSSTGPLFA